MRDDRTITQLRWNFALALAPVPSLPASWLQPAARPTAAAFPGTNGKIVFASDQMTTGNPAGGLEIFTMDADGCQFTQLTQTVAADRSRAWSPDGQRIAFPSARDSSYEIYTVSATSGKQTRRTTNAAKESEPDWPPKSR